MSRLDEISEFLKYYQSLYAQNPNFEITEDTFYNGLMGYDTNQELRQNIRHNFEKWESEFKRTNLQVYVSPRQKRFIQFRNNKHQEENIYDYKLYVNLPAEYIDEGVRKIFGFIARNNIETYSKVADCVRADEIVLRIPNKEDMINVVNFINKDRVLSRVARKTNPFLQRYGVVGAAYDKAESFNSTVCKILVEYFKEKRRTNTMNNVSLQDLQNFVMNFYDKTFTDTKAMQQFFNTQQLAVFKYSHDSKQDQILNYKQMIELLNVAVQRDMSMPEYIQRVSTFQDRRREKIEEDEIYRIYNGMNKKQTETEIIEPTEELPSLTKQTLDSYIELAIRKYGVGNTPKYLESYLKGNPTAITRDENFREIFAKTMTPDVILEIANYDIKSYVAKVYEENHKFIYHLFINATRATYAKYDTMQLETAVGAALNGDFKYITNNGESNYRGRLKSTCSPKDIKDICECFLLKNGLKPELGTLKENFAYLIGSGLEMGQAKSA